MLRIITAGLLAASLAPPVWAQPSSAAQVTVVGFGSAERPADWASISMSVVGEGKTPVAALDAMAKLQRTLEDRLTRLAGSIEAQVTASDLKVRVVRGPTCEAPDYGDAPRLSEGACAVAGHVANLELVVRIAPADRAGDAASLAAELGAQDVALRTYGVRDRAALADAATSAAVDNARTQATSIARASGATLGPIQLVQDPATMDDMDGRHLQLRPAPPHKVASDAFAPTVSVKITVPPVSESARLHVTFSLVK